jgi:hypothetical protein
MAAAATNGRRDSLKPWKFFTAVISGSLDWFSGETGECR